MSDDRASTSQIDKLGESIRRAASPDDELLDRLQAFRATYEEPLAFVQGVVSATLGVETTARIKTTNTIVEKLVRDKARLTKIQDIGGVRVVLDCGLREQDVAVARLLAALEGSSMYDLRKATRHGYRAVHVIARVGLAPIEIQVRTALQDLWAQGMEKLADLVGRGIRYGQPPKVETLRGIEVRQMLTVAEGTSLGARTVEEHLVEIQALEERLCRKEEELKGTKDRRILRRMARDRAKFAHYRGAHAMLAPAVRDTLQTFAALMEKLR